ncbi:MAG TPA: ATP-binding protein, partial [Solirubrobacteraceae bacterium]|nr:ATP-binding protein [Solirubrobacteraceae bacterium]
EIRAVIFELATDGDGDLRRALHDVVEDVVAGTRLQVRVRTYGMQRAAPGATRHAIVQIAREALFNVVRHADAGHAWVTLRWAPERIGLVVSDDGDGDAPGLRHRLAAGTATGRHFGLAGIGGRVRELGGSATVTRRRGGGVSLRVQVPLPQGAPR